LRIKALEKDLRETNNRPVTNTTRETQNHKAYLANQLKHLKKKEAKNRKDILNTKLANHGE